MGAQLPRLVRKAESIAGYDESAPTEFSKQKGCTGSCVNTTLFDGVNPKDPPARLWDIV
jgi:hypothetical protein